jgi:UDP-2,4-diacetamido-2,4,6-trideoxy-beta-L-altropyranose hydrolase
VQDSASMSTIAFRCDGDGRVGAGHVARCLQLANAFRSGGDDVVLVGCYEGVAAALIEAVGVATLPADDTPAGLPGQVDLAVIDSYEIGPGAMTAAAAAVPVVVVLDAGAAPQDTIGFDYHADADAPVGGLGYAPVDPRYVAARRRRGFERVLISVGGGDAGAALRGEAAQAVRSAGLVATMPGTDGSRPTGLLEEVAAADVAIGAAGVTAYEMACAGLPAVLVPVARNQRRIAVTLAQQGTALATHDISAALRRLRETDLRRRLARRGPAAVDGYGSFRARDALRAAVQGRPLPRVLGYRPAVAADSSAQLAWRNDSASRRGSRNSAMISRGEHDSWFARLLADPDRTLWIVEDASEAVASVRFDVEGEAAEISIVVAPERRGGGIAGQAVREASELFLAAHPAIERIEAVVSVDNPASSKTFERAGFAAGAGEDGGWRAFVLRRAHLASAPQ